MKKYNVAIIGYGWVAGAHIQSINATGMAQVTAVHSSRKLLPEELLTRHGCRIEPTSDLDALLARSDIDAVSICSYPREHARHAIAAARAGKHIILEKPISLTIAEAVEVEKAVAQAGVQVCVCFECRFSSQFLATKAVIDAGLLGAIHYGEVDYYHGIGPWYGQFRWNTRKAEAGSSLLSAGCHALDALLLCMGGEVESVTSMGTNSVNSDFRKYDYPTTSVTLLKFSDGRLGKVASVIDCLQPYYFHTHLVGSEGSLLDNRLHSSRIDGLNKAAWSTLSMKLLDSGDVTDHPYQKQFEAFFQSLQQGRPMPLTNLREALRSHKVVLAADHAAATGRTIRLGEFA